MKTLDFNSFVKPILQLTMKDDKQTIVNVSTPTKGLVTELQANFHALQAVLTEENEQTKDALYDLAARLISCNQDGLTVTADGLRRYYKLTLADLVLFYTAYVDFLDEIKSAKN